MTFLLGIAAALAAPFVMTIGFLVWEDNWKGSAFALNLFKCNFVIPFCLIMVFVTRQDGFFPAEVFTLRSVGYLILSSVIGIIIGDWTWLRGLQILGSTKVILMDSLKPFLASFFGWILLDEDLRLAALGGIILTVAGVLIVSLEKEVHSESQDDTDQVDQTKQDLELKDNTEHPDRDTAPSDSLPAEPLAIDTDTEAAVEVSTTLSEPTNSDCVPEAAAKSETAISISSQQIGYAMSILNVVLDTYGSVLTKQHGEEMTVWEINLIRFGFAGLFMMLMSTILHLRERLLRFVTQESNKEDSQAQQQQQQQQIRTRWYSLPLETMSKGAWFRICVGVIFATFLTPALSNYALFQIAIALALTLTSVGPLYSLPLSFLLQGAVPTGRSLIGAALAVAGVIVLAFRGTIPESE